MIASQRTQQKAQQNRAVFWNERIAAATTDQERATVWQNACRTLAVQAARDGRPDVWAALVRHLHDFYSQHSQ